MKRRAFKVLNFFAFNLLFFALYLNFIHKDKNVQEAIHASHVTNFNSTVLTEDVKKAEIKNVQSGVEKTNTPAEKNAAALKLSFN